MNPEYSGDIAKNNGFRCLMIACAVLQAERKSLKFGLSVCRKAVFETNKSSLKTCWPLC